MTGIIRALVRGNEITEERIAVYMPDNYKVKGMIATARGDAVLIEGTDRAGWTFDDYVKPRLASGLWFAERVLTDTEVVTALEAFVRTPEWSVSMLEDVAELVHSARPYLYAKEDHDADGSPAWQSH